MAGFQNSLARELRHLRHDKGDLFMTLGMMPLLLFMIWWIFSAGQPDSLPVALVDEDNSSVSRQVARLVDATPGIRLVRQYENSAPAIDALRKRDVYAVLVMPRGLAEKVYSGQPAQALLQLNSQYSTYASTIERNVTGAVLTAGVGIGLERLKMQGVFEDASLTVAMPVAVVATPLFNEGPNYEVFLGGTLIAALFQILAMILAVSAIGRELRDGTAGQWLSASGESVSTALVAKLLPYFAVVCAYALVFVAFFHGLAPDSYSGRVLGTWGSMVLMIAAAMAVGVVIVAATKSFRMGLSVAGFYSAPAFAYSGQAFPLVAMPEAAQYWASILPLTHWLALYNQFWVAGAPFQAVYKPLGIIAAMLAGAAIVGYALMRKSAFEPANWGRR